MTQSLAKISFYDKIMNKFFYMGKPKKHVPAALMLMQMSIKHSYTDYGDWKPMFLELKAIYDSDDSVKAFGEYKKKLESNLCGTYFNVVD